MKLNKFFLMFAMGIVTLTADAQDVPQKLKEAQMQGFGSKNKEAILQGAKTDSLAKAGQTTKAETDTDPEFPGGEIFLQAYLKKKLLHSGVNGKGDVVVSFMVDKKGNIYGAEVTKSAGSTLDTAAFNIVTGMPRWRPGLTKGEPAEKPASVTVSFGKEE
ncbi:MAG: energy transducer TonB [Bacteroidaceae bacterium]|nr:energy transducer TonB [Bacteroidaceae bacterium]